MSIQQAVRDRLLEAVKRDFDVDLPEVASEVPPKTEMGDLAFPLVFDLAKRLKEKTGQKQNPREIAMRLSAYLADIPGVARVEVAGPGYLNVYFDRARQLAAVLRDAPLLGPHLGGKIVVEHTSVNPNKAAHIGHVRNAVLGDTVVRLLTAAGENVETQNYIDNTGVQVADVVVGFKYLEDMTLDQVKGIEGKFDYFCWDLYSRVGVFYEEDKTRLSLRTQTLHELEAGSGPTYELADYVATRIINCHLDTMLRVGVEYDVLPRESDVLHLHMWEAAFALLKSRGAIVYEVEGNHAGCWVMRAGGGSQSRSEAPDANAGTEPGADDNAGHEADKVIVRSNGTVTYTGKDIAFHLWKLGKLDLDFYYKPFRKYPDGRTAWMTTTDPAEDNSDHPRFGAGSAYFNVIDIGQSYPQHYVKVGLLALGDDPKIERSGHLAYERVTLTPAAVEALGAKVKDEDAGRTSISMSGRKGLGVKVDDLIDQLESGALAEVGTRHPELSQSEQQDVAYKIAVGALRYFLLKYTRTSVISFDFKEALSFEGETGPYIQYSVVRINSILRKLTEAGVDVAGPAAGLDPDVVGGYFDDDAGDDLWSIVRLAARLPEVVKTALTSLEPAVVAKWAFQLAQSFNLFYHNHHILSEADSNRQALLVAIVVLVRRELTRALDLLGIEAPERM